MRRITLYVTALLLAVGYPLTAMADTPEAAATDSSTATTTDQTPPPKTYTYNAATGHWDSNEWYYDAASGTYKAVPPAPTTTIVTPDSSTTTPTGDTAPSSTTPTSSDPTVDSTNNATGSTDVTTNTNATSNVNGDATSGDASVLKNTTGGNATSGDAASTATIVNSVNSTIAAGNNDKAASFTYNVMGDVNGDIMLYPMMLKTMLESQANPNATSSQSISATQNNQLTNNVNLASTSGNATVSNNTTGGNATTGSASTVANIMNILNSMIAANQSFVGTVNIYGSLTGDILIAPDFIPQMIANNQASQVGTVDKTAVDTQNTSNIVNNISLAAQSGSAAVLGNTKAGDATSGSANSNVVIFNLTGHDIVASNSLLVFVNVLGKWVGVIVDAPAGATSAMVGENVTKNSVAPDLTVNAQTNNSITNNVTLVARTGDAVVSNNTTGGNATSGNASALANVANISNSQIGISNWFGILFINVFGSWYGSFGVNTAYGDPVVQNSSSPTGSGGGTPGGVFVFVPKSTGSTKASKTTIVDTRQLQNQDQGQQAVLAAATTPGGTTPPSQSVEAPAKANNDTMFNMGLVIAAGSLLLVGLSVVGLRRLLRS